MTEELKPCPACGHSPAILLENEEKRYRYSYACGNTHCGFTTLFCSTVERAAMYWNRRPLETVSLSTDEHSHTIVLPKPEEQVVRMVVREVLEEKQKHGMQPFDAARCVCGSIPQGHVAVDRDGYRWYFAICKECHQATTPELTVDLAKIQWNNLIYKKRDSEAEKREKEAERARNYFLREAKRVGIKDPEQYLKPSPTCDNCRFGVLCGSRPNVHRQCQKCSPYVNKDGASKWPRVGDHAWCGDHEYKEDRNG